MTEAALLQKVTYAEYLAVEETATRKHEFLDGEVYEMTGGTVEHGIIATNLARLVGNLLAERPCVVLNSDVRVRVEATGLSTYPDVSVVCGVMERSPVDPNAVISPIVLVEVLSNSTELYDRGEKFAHYRRIPSLQEYVLVSQHERRVEVYQRGERKRWTFSEYETTEVVSLASLGIELAVDEIYRNVVIGTPTAPLE